MKPFLKWAGGKRWLTSRYPELFEFSFDRYIEPFLGSGAVFFHLEPSNSVLSDENQALIELYKCMSDDWVKVFEILTEHSRLHCHSYYYSVRATEPRGDFERAARFLYLNRTCWNGLYRENLRGIFNVPKGTKDAVLMPDDDFAKSASLLRKARLFCSDFEDILSNVAEGDLVFVDPPYTVKHNSNGFLKYNEKIFSWDDQVRLARVLGSRSECGATFIVTNAYHESIRELYSGFASIFRVDRSSVLSGKREFRGSTAEAVIVFGRYAPTNSAEALSSVGMLGG